MPCSFFQNSRRASVSPFWLRSIYHLRPSSKILLLVHLVIIRLTWWFLKCSHLLQWLIFNHWFLRLFLFNENSLCFRSLFSCKCFHRVFLQHWGACVFQMIQNRLIIICFHLTVFLVNGWLVSMVSRVIGTATLHHKRVLQLMRRNSCNTRTRFFIIVVKCRISHDLFWALISNRILRILACLSSTP